MVPIGNVAAGKKAENFKIPNVECSYVQFFANDKQTQLSVVYNFYNQNQETENAFQYDASDKYCYTYTAENTGSWGTPHGGSEVVSEVVYFDSTLSSYAYAGDGDSKQKTLCQQLKTAVQEKCTAILRMTRESILISLR